MLRVAYSVPRRVRQYATRTIQLKGVLTAILLLAAVLRFYNISWRSLSGDEGATLYFSSLPTNILWQHMADLFLDRHPLFFYIFVQPWYALMGTSDLAIRALSVLLGVLTVALVYPIGRHFLGHNRAALAMLLVALNPLVIYQHQDARMYAPALFLTTLAIWVAMQPLPLGRKALTFMRLFIIIVSLASAVYMHVLAVAAIPFVVWLLLWKPRAGWREIIYGLVALALTALLILPYVYNIYQAGEDGAGEFSAINVYRTLLGALKTIFDFQAVAPIAENLWLPLLVIILLIALLRDWPAFIPSFLWFGTSFGLVTYVLVSIQFFNTKPYAFVMIPLALLISTVLLGRSGQVNWVNGSLTLLVVLFLGAGLNQLWHPDNRAENFREAACFVERQATAADTVIMHVNWYQHVFGHYYKRPFATPFPNNISSVDEITTGFAPYAHSEIVWLVQAGTDRPSTGLPDYLGDQQRMVETWFQQQYPLTTEVFPGGVEVKGYVLQYRLLELPPSATALDVQYPHGLALKGFRLARQTFPTRDIWLHPPSTWIPLTLFWQAQEPLPATVVVNITLEDEQGQVFGGLLRRDNDVLAFHPWANWQVGEFVRVDYDVVVNPEIPAGRYKLVVWVTDGETQTPLPHDGGVPWLIVEQVEMEEVGRRLCP